MKTRIVILFTTISGLFGQGLFCQSLVGTAGQSAQAAGTFVSWTIGEPIILTLTGTQASLTQGFQQPWERYRVHGVVRYANVHATPLQGIQVNVHPLGGGLVQSYQSNAHGHYYLHDVPPGHYAFSGLSNLPAGAINATDALLVMKHFTLHQTLMGIYLQAADVDGSGAINATDALLICRLFVDSISIFPAGRWLIGMDTLVLGPTTQQHDLQALCYGDVNGSFIPGPGTKRSVYLHQEGELVFPAKDDFLIPIKVSQACEAGAVSLSIREQSGALELLDVRMPGNQGFITHTTRGQELRLAWYSQQSLARSEGEPLLWINARLKDVQAYLNQGIQLQIGEESEVADPDARVYEQLSLTAPLLKLQHVPAALSMGEIYPNPASDHINIRVGLDKDASIQIGIHDARGALISQEIHAALPAGMHELSYKINHLPTGLYFVHLQLPGSSQAPYLVKKFVVLRDK